jgi:hypothetical protein
MLKKSGTQIREAGGNRVWRTHWPLFKGFDAIFRAERTHKPLFGCNL